MTSTPTSACRRTIATTASRVSRASAAASYGSPRSFATSNSRSAGGRGRLPVWVVRMRLVLVFIASPPLQPTFTRFRRFRMRIAPLNDFGNRNMPRPARGPPTLERSDASGRPHPVAGAARHWQVWLCANPPFGRYNDRTQRSELDENWPVLSNPGAEAVDRAERSAAHLRGAGADPLCRGARVRQRLVFRAPFPPGVVAQQRPRPDSGGGEPAHQRHPARH